jgi:hypothetical protein
MGIEPNDSVLRLLLICYLWHRLAFTVNLPAQVRFFMFFHGQRYHKLIKFSKLRI